MERHFILPRIKQVAVEAVRTGGKIAKDWFNGPFIAFEKGEFGDLVTEVDHAAEREILRIIQSAFPEHQIHSEEIGTLNKDSDWLWMVDPLDGTNNYALGIPVYGVSITVFYRDQPLLGVIFDSHLEKLYIAEKNRGAFCDNQPLRVQSKDSLRKMTVGWIQGHQVQKNETFTNIKQHLDMQFKRVLRLWAPSLLWCMLARGDLDGIVLFNSEGEDLYAGLLMAKEAGADIFDYKGNEAGFERISEPYLIACHPRQRDTFLQIVQTALQN